jgi:DNA helicase IV
LGETGVVLATPGQLYPGVDATDVDAPEVARIKGDPRMAEVLRQAVRARQRLLRHPVRFVVDGDEIKLRPRIVADARARARQTGRPHNEARPTFVKHLLDDLSAQLAAARSLDLVEEKPELVAELRAHLDVRREINLLWHPRRHRAVDNCWPADRLAGASGFSPRRAAPAPAPGAAWTVADVALLDSWPS